LKTYAKIALVGNPNSGKSSLFNQLTGLNQKVGNFPGVTVDKKTGICAINATTSVQIIDLPGTYSLYPKSLDERVVMDIIANPKDKSYPDMVVVVIDAASLKRNLLLFTEIRDLGLPVVLALNMLDVAHSSGISIDKTLLQKKLQVPVVEINARTGEGLADLKNAISQSLGALKAEANGKAHSFIDASIFAPEVVGQIKDVFGVHNDYLAIQYAHQGESLPFLSLTEKEQIEQLRKKYNFKHSLLQAKETIARYERIDEIIGQAVKEKKQDEKEDVSTRIDKVLLHPLWGYVVFFVILFLIFQAIFAWASYPMDLIDAGIASLNTYLQSALPESMLVSLLTDGLIAGIGGILIFIPQIAILFAFIAILEESGYMARVVVLMDKWMRKFGLNGKSVVPLISGVACAVPAIMATRNIDNWKDRLITIMVTPLMSCSARIPIYTILIALVVPETKVAGFLNLQGIALMGMYLLGFLAAIFSALLMKLILKTKGRSFLIMEIPVYKMPRWGNVGLTILEKVKAFVLEAGKIIIAISIVLWVMASYGPSGKMDKAEAEVKTEKPYLTGQALDNEIASRKLEYSYAGHFGKFMEPAIRPLGYDWKIGIALLTSFAAREVFVGTLSTIYSVGSDTEDTETIKERMLKETYPGTGLPVYTPALAFSLLIFYAFAMQCMSTLAIVHRETKGWKWPMIQLVYMTALAYISAFVVYNLMK
jgi:ferrous iron transport protein B